MKKNYIIFLILNLISLFFKCKLCLYLMKLKSKNSNCKILNVLQLVKTRLLNDEYLATKSKLSIFASTIRARNVCWE